MILERYDNLRRLVQKNFSERSQRLVDKALDFASERLSGLSRYDGEPMLCHGVAVAEIVISEMGLGINSTLATIIHDVIRVAYKTNDEHLIELSTEVRELFGEEALGVAVGLCNISQIKLNTESKQADNFRELIISYSSDPRVILIKLADRLEVMRSLEIFPKDKWHKKSWESLNLYAQIAHKLGLYRIKSELEDLALRYLEPAMYNEIEMKLAEGEAARNAFIKEFIKPIDERLKSCGMKYHIKGRTKSIFSIWNKIQNNNVTFEGIYDIFAIRIVIDCHKDLEKQQCWMAYSLVSDCYIPNPERLKDWITIPKSNGYESLHTTVAAGKGRWVEIQIRSERMDAVAERGIAAHWRYKGVNQGAQSAEKWLERLRELMDQTTESIADRFDAKPANEEIFIFTPNGDIRKLSDGATLLDFAFEIHSNLGTTCVGGRINGRSGSIRERLKNGDVVEILTQKNQTPKADWLSFVVTSKARTKIKNILREQKAQSAQIGREELERKMKNWKIAIPMDEAIAYLCKEFKVRLLRGGVDGIIASGAVRLFMPHGTSHSMGMDVHDCEALGERSFDFTPYEQRARSSATCIFRDAWILREGAVITNEPGVYFIEALIRESRGKGLYQDVVNYPLALSMCDFGGVRIEDDLIITKDGAREVGCDNPIPKSIEEIENYMRQ